MPASQSAYEVIAGAMRLLGAIATGETPTAQEANDGLNTLNDLLESWSLESLSVYGTDNQTFQGIANQGLYTIGPGGNFDTTPVGRPVRISGGYCTFNGVDFGFEMIGEDEYNRISLKTQAQSYPMKGLYINSSPLGILKFWPVPTLVLPVVLNIDRILTQVPTLPTVIGFPPGYFVAIKYALSIMLAPDYGILPSAAIMQVAGVTKANLKRANKKKREAMFDPALTIGRIHIWQTG
jgi:hypothetical protein